VFALDGRLRARLPDTFSGTPTPVPKVATRTLRARFGPVGPPPMGPATAPGNAPAEAIWSTPTQARPSY